MGFLARIGGHVFLLVFYGRYGQDDAICYWYKTKNYPGIIATMMDRPSNKRLGDFLRAHRERLAPPAGGASRRRTPGMRREELADLAGISATWLTWLEQGREVTASGAALVRLATALRLTPAERASLFDLAGRRDPDETVPDETELPAEIAALPDQFSGPAYLLDHLWTARAWNEAAASLFMGWLDPQSDERNLLNFVFLSPAARTLIGNWSDRASRLAAEFRADFNRHPNDDAMGELVASLTARSPDFARLWKAQTVLGREGGERHFNHPAQGNLSFHQTTLLVAARQDIKLVCLTAR
jgi:transcriptional regulator with XRE-family HTH domain